jgi:hypothetical protein
MKTLVMVMLVQNQDAMRGGDDGSGVGGNDGATQRWLHVPPTSPPAALL